MSANVRKPGFDDDASHSITYVRATYLTRCGAIHQSLCTFTADIDSKDARVELVRAYRAFAGVMQYELLSVQFEFVSPACLDPLFTAKVIPIGTRR
jgi:hypothetical protein